MNQYFVKYSMNGKSSNTTFSLRIDVKPGITAKESMRYISEAIVDLHKTSFKEYITDDDIVIQVLTRLD
jgi:hypothetical protein